MAVLTEGVFIGLLDVPEDRGAVSSLCIEDRLRRFLIAESFKMRFLGPSLASTTGEDSDTVAAGSAFSICSAVASM